MHNAHQVEDAVRVVCWGGGVHQLLAAAVGYSVYIISLDSFFEAMFTGQVFPIVSHFFLMNVF